MENEKGIEELLAAAKTGDKWAEGELFSKLRARISSLVQYSIWKPHDAEDIVEEIMETILTKYKKTDFPKGLLPWVNGITYNKVKNYIRRVKREPIRLDVEVSQNEKERPDRIVEGLELQGMIERALAKLNKRHKEIMKALLQGEIKSYIAERSSETPSGTIYSDIHRCRKRFAELLKEEGYEIEMY